MRERKGHYSPHICNKAECSAAVYIAPTPFLYPFPIKTPAEVNKTFYSFPNQRTYRVMHPAFTLDFNNEIFTHLRCIHGRNKTLPYFPNDFMGFEYLYGFEIIVWHL